MPERFKNPPLVELIAELRWGASSAIPGPQGSPQAFMMPRSQHEEFFMRFGSKAATIGYERVERVLPPGFAALPFQTVYRFRRREQEQGTSLYQLGSGVFSANITPPYHSWEQFRPVVEQGVECLLETRSEHEAPFAPVILRYIDAFGKKFTEGAPAATFIQETLGFRINTPDPLRDEMASEGDMKLALQLAIPLKASRQMNLVLAEGIVNGEQATLMDLAVLNEHPIQPTKSDVMDSFDASHDIIHRVFVGITRKLYPIMELIEGGGK